MYILEKEGLCLTLDCSKAVFISHDKLLVSVQCGDM